MTDSENVPAYSHGDTSISDLVDSVSRAAIGVGFAQCRYEVALISFVPPEPDLVDLAFGVLEVARGELAVVRAALDEALAFYGLGARL